VSRKVAIGRNAVSVGSVKKRKQGYMNIIDEQQSKASDREKVIEPLTEEAFKRYQSQINEAAEKHVEETRAVCEQFETMLSVFPKNDKEWNFFVQMWFHEVVQTLNAVEQLQRNGFTLQALSLSRVILEIYFTLEWLFEKDNPEQRMELLKIKSLSDNLVEMNKHLREDEREFYQDDINNLTQRIADRTNEVVMKFGNDFPNKESVEKEIRQMKSYPKPEKAAFEVQYEENQKLYGALSSAVHGKDLSERVVRFVNKTLPRDDRHILFFKERLVLIEASFAALHITGLIAKKCGIDITEMRPQMLRLHQNREAFVFARS
jgi:hypothetical protein